MGFRVLAQRLFGRFVAGEAEAPHGSSRDGHHGCPGPDGRREESAHCQEVWATVSPRWPGRDRVWRWHVLGSGKRVGKARAGGKVPRTFRVLPSRVYLGKARRAL